MKPGITACGLLLGAAAGLAQPAPTRTPVAARLSGGFGRPRTTPVPPSDGGQSLADVVHAAKTTNERGENPSREKSGLTIDNNSLVKATEKGRVSTSKVAKAKPAATPALAPAAAAPEPSPGTADAPQASEAQWRQIAQTARQRVADAKAKVAELDAAVKKLETEFYAWDDGQYRDRVIKPNWDKAREQLENAKREQEAAEKDLADLPEKARKAGAFPGWIRE
ncbi:MAG: hypothetical protein ABI968_03545 [Acidobacteriota bacterium]